MQAEQSECNVSQQRVLGAHATAPHQLPDLHGGIDFCDLTTDAHLLGQGVLNKISHGVALSHELHQLCNDGSWLVGGVRWPQPLDDAPHGGLIFRLPAGGKYLSYPLTQCAGSSRKAASKA